MLQLTPPPGSDGNSALVSGFGLLKIVAINCETELMKGEINQTQRERHIHR